MKKVAFYLSTFSLISSIASGAPINSPIYMPKEDNMKIDLAIGYSSSRFDSPSGDAFKGYSIIGNGQFGIKDEISLLYGFSYGFDRTVTGESESSYSSFDDFYIGVDGRILSIERNSLNLKLKVGNREVLLAEDSDNNNTYTDFNIQYGWEGDFYNLGLTAGLIHHQRDNWNNKSKTDLYLKFDNEFIITKAFNIGLDLTYIRVDELSENGEMPVYKDYNQYYALIDFNYNLNNNNTIGVYYKYGENNMKLTPYSMPGYEGKDLTENAFGIKYSAEF